MIVVSSERWNDEILLLRYFARVAQDELNHIARWLFAASCVREFERLHKKSRVSFQAFPAIVVGDIFCILRREEVVEMPREADRFRSLIRRRLILAGLAR